MLNVISDELRKWVRVLKVATRPRLKDFERMATVTAIGVIFMGVLGIIVSLLLHDILK
jgi:protein translocase SEC61 complex gamma subunit